MNYLVHTRRNFTFFLFIFVSVFYIHGALAQVPTISNISPTTGGIGTLLTITGGGFNANAANTVYFGAVKVTANANATGTAIVVNVPAGASSVTAVIVRNNATTLQASSLKSNTPYFTVTHAPPLSISTSSFTDTRYDVGGYTSVSVSGDFDNDGYADIAAGAGGSAVNIYKNNGLGSFSLASALSLSGTSGASGFGVGDIDGDGNLDLVVSKAGVGNLDIFLGNGDGTFSALPSIAGVTGGTGGIALDDINNDGYLDLMTNSYSDLYVHIGDGSGSFNTNSPKSLLPVGNPGGGFQTADINKDGFLDLIIPGGNGTNSVLVLLNNQDETFADPILYATGNSAFRVVVGDYNGDGNADLAVLSYVSENITLLEGDGAGGFTPFPSSPISMSGTNLGIAQGDFDGDGIIDLVVGGGTTSLIPLLKGDGAGNFTSFPTFPYNVSPSQPNGVLSSDFNNDGVADIAFSGSNAFHVLLSPPSFRTTWVTTDGQITIPTSGGGYNYDVVWTNLTTPGLGNGAITGQSGSYTITGLTNGDTYQVLIRGDFPRINFNNGGDKDKILTVEEWGNIQWSNMQTAFFGCTNLTVPATDAPDLSGVLSLNQMFRGATSFNESIDHWDVSNIVLFFGMFWNASSFNQPLNSWTITNATSISSMFQGASSFNQPLSNWVTTGLTDIKVMFKNASSFNQPVNHFDVSLVTDFGGTFEGATNFDQPLNNWDMSAATSLSLMFYNASSFNQDLSMWDVSSVNTMGYMFGFASAFDQDLGDWDIGQVTSMIDMLWLSNLSVSNYDNTLIGWATISGSEIQIPSGITSFRANGLTYCNAETARQFLIDTQGWTITLDTKGASCPPTISGFSPTAAATAETVTISGVNFTGATAVTFGGTAAASFVVTDTEITATVGSGTSGNVAVVTPAGSASMPGFTFNVPEIEVLVGATNVNSGDTQTLATTVQPTDATRTFTINNTGTANLVISSASLSTGTAYSVSSITSPIAAGGSTTFTVTLDGSNDGNFTDVLTIANNDGDEGSFVINLSGTINPTPVPEIEVLVGATNVNSGDTQTLATAVQPTDATRTFTINNTGTANLVISSATLSTGTTYSVSSITSPIAAGGSTTFTVTLDGSNDGNFTDVLTIANNDGDEGSFVINLSGTINPTPVPEIEVLVGATNVNSGDTQTLATAVQPTDATRTFTINNTGTANLVISSATLSTGTAFSVSSITSPIAAGGSTTFTVSLDGSNDGNFTDVLTIANNDGDEGSFVINLSGTINPTPVPEIEVLVGATNVNSGDTQTLATAVQPTDATRTFTINNTGTANLVISSATLSTGTTYSVSSIASPIAAGGSTTFTVTLDGSNDGNFTDVLTIANNDGDEGSFVINLSGTINPTPVPEIEVLVGATNVNSGDTQTLATAVQPTDATRTFTINNTGTANLVISSATLSTGTAYSISSIASPIAAGGSTTFTVTLDGSNDGNFTDVLTIANNDGDEGSFVINLSGTINPTPVPEIEVLVGATNVNSGDTQTLATAVQPTDATRTFTINNTGTANLVISSASLSTGTAYSVSSIASPIAAGGSTTFTVSLDGSNDGNFTDVLTIANNDGDEGSFVINLSGTINPTPVPEIEVLVGATNVNSGDTQTLATAVQPTDATRTFTINNTGTANLVISSATLSSGTAFSVSSIASPIAAGGSTTFTVTLDGSNDGNFTDVLTIANNDGDEGSFVINLSGTITPTPVPEIEVLVGATNVNSGDTQTLATAVQPTDATRTFTINNTGTANLVISSATLSTGTAYSISSIASPIAAGGSTTFTVSLDGSNDGNFTDVLTIANNDGDEGSFVINLSGTINPTPVPEIEVVNNGTILVNNEVVSFGSVIQNEASDQPFTINNTGTADLVVSDIQLTNGVAYAISGITLPATITAGSSSDFTITLTSNTAQLWTDVVTITSNDADEAAFSLNLSGTVTQANGQEITVSYNGSPLISGAGTIAFGELTQGAQASETFTIENTGTNDLVITALLFADGSVYTFSGLNFPITLSPGDSLAIELLFNTSNVGEFTDTITIMSNDPNLSGFELALSGTVIPVPLPIMEVRNQQQAIANLVQFGTVKENSKTTLLFDIANIGTAALQVSAISSSNDQFVLSAVNLPLTVSAGTSNAFELSFTATQVGAFESTITITSNDPNKNSFAFNVRAVVSGGRAVVIITNPDNTTERIIISDEDIDLGQAKFNLDLVKVFGIENLSDSEELTINSITTDNPMFRISEVPTSILAGAWEQFTLTLNSKRVGINRGRVTVSTSINDFSFNVVAEVIADGDPELVVINFLTPNGDNRHDFLFIENIDFYTNNTVTIFNRWGNTLNTINNYDNIDRIFKGITDNGEELLTGNYYYVIDKGNGDKRLKGFFFIQR